MLYFILLYLCELLEIKGEGWISYGLIVMCMHFRLIRGQLCWLYICELDTNYLRRRNFS